MAWGLVQCRLPAELVHQAVPGEHPTHTAAVALPPSAALQPLPAARVRLAAATGLAAAAVQAKLLADQEEREVQRLVLAAVESQFKKVHAKLQVGATGEGRIAGAVAPAARPPPNRRILRSRRAPLAAHPTRTPSHCVLTPSPRRVPVPHRHPTLLPLPNPHLSPPQYLEELDSVMASERLSLEAMRGKFIDDYAQEVANNLAAGIPPPPARQPPAGAAAAAPDSGPGAAPVAGMAPQQ